jgi:hypothetical protein
MSTATKTLEQIRQDGLAALKRELGMADMIRFLQMFETGRGDYTQQRQEWLKDADIESVLAEIRQRQQQEAASE